MQCLLVGSAVELLLSQVLICICNVHSIISVIYDKLNGKYNNLDTVPV